MDKYGFYNTAIKNLGLSGSYALSTKKFVGIKDNDIATIEAEAEALHKRYLANEIKLKKQQEIRKIIEEINEISMLGGDVTELKNKLQASVPIFDLAIGKDDISERYNRTFFAQKGEPKIENGAIKFDGNSYYRITKKVTLKGKSFNLKALVKVDEIKKKNYFFGDGGNTKNKALHIGFRDENTFTVDFFANGINMEVKQEVGKPYDIEFDFNADTKESILSVNGIEAKHTFDGALEDNGSYLGRGMTNNFVGSIYSLTLSKYGKET